MKPKDLPVYQQKDKILSALETSPVIIVESPTGSGKTTQLPIILDEAGYTQKGVVGITQPRRIATLSVCEYIATQISSEIPGRVGYKMRFEDMTLPSTEIKILTDGTLLQEMKGDPMLSRYSVIMVDEAHERSLNIDFILGLLKNIIKVRDDFKVIISSATINPGLFSKYFNNAPIVHIEGSMYPVQTIYDPLAVDANEDLLIQKIVANVIKAVKDSRSGDILIFLSGEFLIKQTVQALYSTSIWKKLLIIPLYGRLSKEEQEGVFIKTPFGKTKVIVSTNIAETSITIDGITTVIDSGLCKINYYNPQTFTSSLIQTDISRASADQRKGRAGRTRKGYCYRLYKVENYYARPMFSKEDIYKTDLAEVVLRMVELGIKDFHTFDFISPPNRKGIEGARETLLLLDAIDEDHNLTSIGQKMILFPLMPRLSRMIIEAILHYPDVLFEVLIVTSFLSTNSPQILPQGEEIEARQAHHAFRDPSGDFMAYVKLFNQFSENGNKTKFCERYYLDERVMTQIVSIHGQLEEIVGDKIGVPVLSGGSNRDIVCACGRGLIQFVCAKVKGGIYRSATADRIFIHPGSVLFKDKPPFIVAGEIVKTSKTYARTVSGIEKEWLKLISPDLLSNLNHPGKIGKNGLGKSDRLNERDRKGKKGKGKRGKDNDAEKRDTTLTISIAGESFPVHKDNKGKKVAVIETKDLYRAIEKNGLQSTQDFNTMLGELYHKGRLLITGCRVNDIIAIVSVLNPKDEMIENFPQSNFSTGNDSEISHLLDNIDYILKISTEKKKGKFSTGFIALESDLKGTYWFKREKYLSHAITDSLSSLDKLADEINDAAKPNQLKTMGEVYAKLSKLYDM